MDAPIRAASLRFSRVDPARWPKAVRTLVALGFNAIDLPLVWREYASSDGAPDEARLAHDLAALLRIVADAGARAVLRLGPWPTIDVEGLGVPAGVLADPSVRSHTRRRNPRWVSDHLRVVPLPSLRSETYNAAARQWITAAVTAAVAASPSPDVIARVLVGHGAPTLLRDSPDDLDAAGLDLTASDAANAADAEAEATVAFLRGLSESAREAGATERSLRLAIQGDPLASAAAARLAETDGLAWSAPPTRAGVRSIWRDARLATTLPHGHHLDLRAGHAPMQAPSRATDALDIARIALGAGARDLTVLHGCSGGGWVGAILDEQGEPRIAASRWQALLSWAASLPAGVERGRRIGRDPSAIARARSASVFGALPISWLSRWGFSLDELSSEPVGADALETAATSAGEAWAPTFTSDGKPEESVAVALDPEAGAMVRAVDTPEGRAWVLASVGLATVAASAGGVACAVEPGAVVVLRTEERAGG